MSDLSRFTFGTDASLRDVLEVIQRGSLNAAFAIATDGRLLGVVTDGDARRALLGGASLEDPALPFLSGTPIVGRDRDSRAVVLDMMRARHINQVPIVDDSGRLVGVHTLLALVGREPRTTVAVILAGGRGTRLHPVTARLPKPMVPVAGRPILERLVTHLVGFGVTDIVLAVGYLASTIIDHFGDGSSIGCRIRYLVEDPEQPLGTAGPLAGLAGLIGPVTDPVLVLNGDLLTSVDIGGLLAAHDLERPAVTVATSMHQIQVPYAVVEEEAGRILSIEEKPVLEVLINLGVYVLEPRTIELIPSGVSHPMTQVLDDALEHGWDVRAWQSVGEWMDVGSPSDLASARGQD